MTHQPPRTALKITCLCVNTRFTAFKVSRARRYHRRVGKGWGGWRGSWFSHTYRRTDWRAERTRVLQKGWVLAWCRSSMDLLQDLALSKKPSSPFSCPSKSNLGGAHGQDRRADTEEARGRREGGVLGQQGSTGESQGVGGLREVTTKTVIKLHDKAQQRF